MGAEQTVLTNTIPRSYFNFKNCYTGGFILSHFTFQYKLHKTKQTVNFRVSVFPLSPWTFKQDKQENKLKTCGGLIILTVRSDAFAGRALQNALKMESVPFLKDRRHAEGQWDKAKKSHTSYKSMGLQIPQLWLHRALLWEMQCDGIWVEIISSQLLTPPRRAQRTGTSERSCRPKTWEVPYLLQDTSSSAGLPRAEVSSLHGSANRAFPRIRWEDHRLPNSSHFCSLILGTEDWLPRWQP